MFLFSRTLIHHGGGLPFKPRHVTKDEISKLRDNHIWHSAPTLENVEMIFGTIDVMDSFVSYAIFAWDVNDNLHMIADGKLQYIELDDAKRAGINEDRKQENLPPIETVEDLIGKEWLKKDGVGIKATFWMIDQGGHRADDVKHLAKMHRNVIMQKGTTMTSVNWKMSDNQDRLILTNEKYWRSTAIYYLYSQKNSQENYLWFYPDISEETLAEIRDVKPDESSKWGNEPQNWCSKTGKDHAFDLLKYAYCARDFALQSFMKSRYRFAKSPLILRRFEKQKKKEEIKQQSDAKKSSWFAL